MVDLVWLNNSLHFIAPFIPKATNSTFSNIPASSWNLQGEVGRRKKREMLFNKLEIQWVQSYFPEGRVRDWSTSRKAVLFSGLDTRLWLGRPGVKSWLHSCQSRVSHLDSSPTSITILLCDLGHFTCILKGPSCPLRFRAGITWYYMSYLVLIAVGSLGPIT